MLVNDTNSLKKVVVITINSFCVYEALRNRLLTLGLCNAIQSVERDPDVRKDPTIEKYLSRIKKAIEGKS